MLRHQSKSNFGGNQNSFFLIVPVACLDFGSKTMLAHIHTYGDSQKHGGGWGREGNLSDRCELYFALIEFLQLENKSERCRPEVVAAVTYISWDYLPSHVKLFSSSTVVDDPEFYSRPHLCDVFEISSETLWNYIYELQVLRGCKPSIFNSSVWRYVCLYFLALVSASEFCDLGGVPPQYKLRSSFASLETAS